MAVIKDNLPTFWKITLVIALATLWYFASSSFLSRFEAAHAISALAIAWLGVAAVVLFFSPHHRRKSTDRSDDFEIDTDSISSSWEDLLFDTTTRMWSSFSWSDAISHLRYSLDLLPEERHVIIWIGDDLFDPKERWQVWDICKNTPGTIIKSKPERLYQTHKTKGDEILRLSAQEMGKIGLPVIGDTEVYTAIPMAGKHTWRGLIWVLAAEKGAMQSPSEERGWKQFCSQFIEQWGHWQKIDSIQGELQTVKNEFNHIKKENTDLVSKADKLNERLLRLSGVDLLTGLPNAHGLEKHMRLMIHQCRRSLGSFSFAIGEIDQFDHISRRLPDKAIPTLMLRLFRRLRAETRSGDVLCRCDDNQLAVLMPNTEVLQGLNLCERLRSTAKRVRFVSKIYGEFRITFSFGVVDFDPKNSPPLVHDAIHDTINRCRESVRQAIRRDGDCIIPGLPHKFREKRESN